MQDLSKRVGTISSAHDESVDERIRWLISSSVTGVKSKRGGGGSGGMLENTQEMSRGILEQRVMILSSKYLRKEEARLIGEAALGNVLTELRCNKEFMHDQSFFGSLLLAAMAV